MVWSGMNRPVTGNPLRACLMTSGMCGRLNSIYCRLPWQLQEYSSCTFLNCRCSTKQVGGNKGLFNVHFIFTAMARSKTQLSMGSLWWERIFLAHIIHAFISGVQQSRLVECLFSVQLIHIWTQLGTGFWRERIFWLILNGFLMPMLSSSAAWGCQWGI